MCTPATSSCLRCEKQRGSVAVSHIHQWTTIAACTASAHRWRPRAFLLSMCTMSISSPAQPTDSRHAVWVCTDGPPDPAHILGRDSNAAAGTPIALPTEMHGAWAATRAGGAKGAPPGATRKTRRQREAVGGHPSPQRPSRGVLDAARSAPLLEGRPSPPFRIAAAGAWLWRRALFAAAGAWLWRRVPRMRSKCKLSVPRDADGHGARFCG